MKDEIGAAVNFITRLVGKNEEISPESVQKFQQNLGTLLAEKFAGHWFPDQPCKGQAFRCIRVNGRERRDPVLERAASLCGLRYDTLRLPVELTLWVDPREVCCRFGEDDGSYCTVASFKDGKENLSDKVIEELTTSHQNPVEPQKKLKTRRKPLEKQNQSSTNSQQQQQTKKCVRHPPTQQKGLSISSKSPFLPPLGYFDWGMPPFSPRGIHPPEHLYMRRPKKPIRPTYVNDRYHWARK